jgi:hypothetical protein
MAEQRHDEPDPRSATGSARQTSPSCSRMLTSYLAHIEQLLEEGRWEAARREAVDLPQIAVALADPQLRSSPERVQQWCHEWLLPEGGYERLVLPCESVPTLALRRLQLHRLAPRTPPREVGVLWPHSLPAEDAQAAQLSTTLVSAARRWYARSACRDATVQSNLARLAVLR